VKNVAKSAVEDPGTKSSKERAPLRPAFYGFWLRGHDGSPRFSPSRNQRMSLSLLRSVGIGFHANGRITLHGCSAGRKSLWVAIHLGHWIVHRFLNSHHRRHSYQLVGAKIGGVNVFGVAWLITRTVTNPDWNFGPQTSTLGPSSPFHPLSTIVPHEGQWQILRGPDVRASPLRKMQIEPLTLYRCPARVSNSSTFPKTLSSSSPSL
jgi:hypothetical protein